MENTQSKGMSKGCMIGLIIGGALLVLCVLLLATCWYYKDDLAKMGAVTLVQGLKTELATNPEDDVDTVQFNSISDAFIERLNADEELDWAESYVVFMTTIQAVMEDQQFTADEVPTVVDAYVQFYPELADMRPTAEEPEPMTEEDSLSTD